MRQGQRELDVLRGQVASVKLLKDGWGRARIYSASTHRAEQGVARRALAMLDAGAARAA